MTDITLLGHSAVRLDRGGATLIVDPGVFSDLGSLAGADAVLVTHAHADHLAAAPLAADSADIWATDEAVDALAQAGADPARLHVATPGDTVAAGGFEVTVLGGQHAQIYPGLPDAQNNAYLIDGAILHPGDSLTPALDPDALDVLLLPVAGPWLRLADAIDLARATPSARVLPVHDAILSAAGTQLIDGVLTAVLGATRYTRPAAGEPIAC